MSAGGKAAGGGIGVIVIALIVMAMGGDPSAILNAGGGAAAGGAKRELTQEDQEWKEFVGVTLADTEEVWTKVMRESGTVYRKPKLVLFSGGVQSGCGYADAQVGPFYCGTDETVYIDTGFFGLLKSRFGAKGDFAPAYVLAHEIGHHIQKLTGALDKVHEAKQRVSQSEGNALSVRLELQADYYAGVWANHARAMAEIDRQDIEEALVAANAIGDDTLQQQGQGRVVPDSFTHGTSEQRMRWFVKGWESGRMEGGDTFSARQL